MALQVWMPFTDGTLKQQGLKNVSPTIGGTVNLTNAGKLGKCATIGTAAGGITLPASSMTSFTECSVAFWIKIISWNSSYATFFQAGLGSTPWNNYIFGILRNNANSNLCFTLTNSSGTSSSATYTTSNLNTGQWYHLAFTYKTGIICTYIDGELDKTYSTTYVPNFAGITHISIGRGTNNSGYQTNCNLNDFRIYDHCLSPMEVKELAKGLVLHYPLNRNGWGQENLLSGNNAKITTWTNYMPDSVILSGDGYDNKYTLIKGIGGWEKIFTDAITVTSGKTYTLSFDYSVEQNYTGYSGQFGLSVCTTSQAKYGADTDVITKVNFGTVQKSKSRTSVTFTATSNTIYLVANGGNINDGQENISFYISYIKLEEGSTATPWCPNLSDVLATKMGLNSTTEYDCSGFCNNGTRTGTFTWTSDTPKYQVSTNFNGSNYIGLVPPDSEIQTVAFWVKWSSIPSTQTIGFIDDGSGLAFGLSYGNIIVSCQIAGAASCYNASVLSANNWYHIVVIKTGATTRKLYINAVEQTANSTTNYWSYINNELQIGKRKNTGEGITGWMSDFRMYATALSADDVKSLYQNSAYIDSSGNVYGAVHTEV